MPSWACPSIKRAPDNVNNYLRQDTIDGAGNLFITDYDNSRIIVITPDSVASVLSIAGLAPALNLPAGLAFDAAGNLYISDYGNGRVVEVSSLFVAGSTSTGIGTVIGTGSYTITATGIAGVAVDSMGNIYIPDGFQGNDPSRIIKVTAGGMASLLTPAGITFSNPAGISVDGMGNIYVADRGNNRIVEITTAGVASVLAINGIPSPTTLTSPFGVTVDPSGNLYIADLGNSRALFVNVSGAALTFPTTATGATSLAQTATVANLGNQALVFSTDPTYTANFSANSSDINPCTSSTSLLPGTNCDVSVEFTPQSVGIQTTGITVTNNSLNVAGSTQQVSVSGTAFNPARSTTTTVTVSLPSSTYGQLLTFTATVSVQAPQDVQQQPQGSPTPTGTVTFTDLTTSTTLASNVSLTSRVATFSLSTLGAGSHTIQAVYTPTSNFSTSSGTVASTIAKANTSTAVTLSGHTLTAAVTVVAPGAGSPTGSVQFLNGSTLLGSVPLSDGTAALTLSVMPSSFTAVYSGDGNFNTSASTAAPQSTTSVIVSPTSSTYGQLLSFTATVSATGTPTGTVTFTDPTTSTTLASNVSLTSGVATFSLSTLGAGSHTIQAVYTPTGNFSTSSGSVTLTIAKAATSTSVTLSGRTLTASVTATPPGAGNPTGSVQFLNGGLLLGTVPMSGGTAALTLSVTPASFTFTAVYSGDGNFNTSTAAPVSQASSSVFLSSSANPSALGQAVTFSASVNGQPPSSGYATGTVQFSDGATALGTASVLGGQAVFTTFALTGGSHNIGARYSGDSTFPPAQAQLEQTVNAPVTMTISAAPIPSVFGQTEVFTASVSATVPAGFQAPTGHVTWVEVTSGTPIGTAPLSSGTATLSLSTLAAGTHVISVLYSGDANWSYASGTLTVTVLRAASSSAVSIAIVSGQLTLMANVAAVTPGAGTPTGSVQFLDTVTKATVATATLSGGTGSATIGTGSTADVLGRAIAAVYSGDSSFNGSTSAPLPALVNAAWNFSGNFAPDEIASLYDITGLTGDTTATPPLTTSLGGVTVTITDSSGAVSPALLYGVYASAAQINLLVPAGTAAGLAVMTITLPGGRTITTVVNIVGTAPGIFTSDATGKGVFAGQVVYVHQDGSQTIVNSTGPISLAVGDQVYLVLYGTGLRHANSVTATVNGASLPVIYFGAQGGSDGLDQINLGPLPANLAGAGAVQLVITADGQAANTVTLSIQ